MNGRAVAFNMECDLATGLLWRNTSEACSWFVYPKTSQEVQEELCAYQPVCSYLTSISS